MARGGVFNGVSRPEIGLHIIVNKWTKKQQRKSLRTEWYVA